ncbi:hypothetical protein Poli38472_012527 [Pythium oligandrum]|uniref:Uncharacterized protein n=1 Tax=Pythium oligandrum TaxID=41045 RepID=A0A8K1FG74_PYTOL|nr:hypothetical protein Poli38472_012527 [Pythium oligandrum]|eukprot:TMW61336.1 hypothetical protein Poli38472_012527 [Pythium oligandrum]
MRALRRHGRGLSTEAPAEKTLKDAGDDPAEENDVRREERTSAYAKIVPVKPSDLEEAKEGKNEETEYVEKDKEEDEQYEEEAGETEDWFAEDAEDEEYVPSESGDSDDEESVTSEVDEETPTVGSLFAYAAGVRFWRTSSDENANDGEDDKVNFTAQDGELWASVNEKEQWVTRFEAAKRAYLTQHGHGIDSAALPEARKQIQHEMKRERRYRNVLLGLAAIYLLRLLSDFTGGVSWLKQPSSSRNQPHTMFVEVHSSAPVADDERSPEIPVPTNLHDDQGAIATPASLLLVSPEETQPRQIDEEHASTHHTPTHSTTEPRMPIETPETIATIVHARGNPQQSDQGAHDSQADAPMTTEDWNISATSSSSSTDVTVHRASSVAAEFATDRINQSTTPVNMATDDQGLNQDGVEVKYQLCRELFYKVIKTRADQDVKVAAIEACSKAVDASEETAENMLKIRAHLLRGDLWSLLYEAEQAEQDYTLAVQRIDSTSALTRAIEVKITSNRWIDLYRKKKYKELRQACQGIIESEEKEASKTLRELASEWLRAYRRETSVLDALTKSRSWTIYRPERDS